MATDKERALELAQSTGVFRPAELAVLEEVLNAYLQGAQDAGYFALVAELTPWQESQDPIAESAAAEGWDDPSQTVEACAGGRESGSVPGTAGFVLYGPTPLTSHTWDIYWIVVGKQYQRCGVGSRLLEAAEVRIRARRGEVIRVETSSLASYEGTRRFYEKHGYQRAGVIPDFYADGDHLVIYYKRLPSTQLAE
jgi:ribosomal protein S18 acetylase RimI-like enzyme